MGSGNVLLHCVVYTLEDKENGRVVCFYCYEALCFAFNTRVSGVQALDYNNKIVVAIYKRPHKRGNKGINISSVN